MAIPRSTTKPTIEIQRDGRTNECTAEVCLSIQNVNISAGTLDIYIINSEDVGGFQFELMGITVIDASGGLAEANDFEVNTSSTTGVVLGYSITNAVIPAGSGVLTQVSFSNYIGDGICFGYAYDLGGILIDDENNVISNPYGNAYETEWANCCTYFQENYDCDGNCIALDDCGVCGGDCITLEYEVPVTSLMSVPLNDGSGNWIENLFYELEWLPFVGLGGEGWAASYYAGQGWFGSMMQINPADGFWLQIDPGVPGEPTWNWETTFSISGEHVIPPDHEFGYAGPLYHLHSGPNLISFPGRQSMDFAMTIAQQNGSHANIQAIVGDGTAASYWEDAPNLGGDFWIGSLTQLEPNKGYWFICNENIPNFQFLIDNRDLTSSSATQNFIYVDFDFPKMNNEMMYQNPSNGIYEWSVNDVFEYMQHQIKNKILLPKLTQRKPQRNKKIRPSRTRIIPKK